MIWAELCICLPFPSVELRICFPSLLFEKKNPSKCMVACAWWFSSTDLIPNCRKPGTCCFIPGWMLQQGRCVRGDAAVSDLILPLFIPGRFFSMDARNGKWQVAGLCFAPLIIPSKIGDYNSLKATDFLLMTVLCQHLGLHRCFCRPNLAMDLSGRKPPP